MTLVEPFNLNTNPVFAELMPGAWTSGGRRTPTRRGASGPVRRGPPAGCVQPRWDTYEVMESGGPSRAGRPAPDDAGRRAGDRSTRHLLDLSAGERDLEALRVRRSSPTTIPTGSPCCSRNPVACSACPMPGRTSASSATPRCPRISSATGSASVVSSRSRTRSTSSRKSLLSCSGSPTAACCARARSPTSSCSIPRRSRPGRSDGSATSRPTPSASPPTSPRACATCS